MQLATHIPFSHILSFFYVTFGLFQRLPTTGTFIGSRKEVLQRTFCGSVVPLEKLGSTLHFIDSLHNITFCVATFESIYLLLLVLILNTDILDVNICEQSSSARNFHHTLALFPSQETLFRHTGLDTLSTYYCMTERGQKCC